MFFICQTSRGTCYLFTAAIIDHGLKVLFNKDGAKIVDLQGKVIGKGAQSNNIYELTAFIISTDVSNNKLWHERFGHLNLASLKEMYNNKMIIHLLEIGDLPNACEACLMGKQH